MSNIIIEGEVVEHEGSGDDMAVETLSPHVVSKHNDLVGASYRLSVAEQRLILLAIAKIDSRKPMPNGIMITAYDYMGRYPVNSKDAYAQLKDAAKQLFNAKITSITGTGKSRAINEVRWVERCSYIKGEGRVELVFSTTVKPYLSRLIGHYTSYDHWRVSGIDSTYSFRLFEMLMQYKSKGWLYITVEELRRRLQLGDAYDRFSNLRARVIDASVKELRNKCSMELDYELIKEHRTVKAIRFSFRLLDQMTLQLQQGGLPVEAMEPDVNAIVSEQSMDAQNESEEAPPKKRKPKKSNNQSGS